MPPVRRLWKAMTSGERILMLAAIIGYVAFIAAVVRAILYREIITVIVISLMNAALTGLLTRSLLGPKGEGL